MTNNLSNVILKPTATVNVWKMLDDWMKDWGETRETCTEKWDLAGVKVLDKGVAALCFRMPVCEYVNNDDGDIVPRVVTNYYRLLVIDTNREEMRKYRFHVQNGYCTDTWFIGGKLYAAVYSFGSPNCTMLQMWPGSDDGHQVKLGKYVSCRVVKRNGEIVAGYARPEEGADGSWQIIRAFDLENGEINSVRTDVLAGVEYMTIGQDDKIYGVTADRKHAFIWDGEKVAAFELPIADAAFMATAAGGDAVYIATRTEEEAPYYIRRIAFDEDGSQRRQNVFIEAGDELLKALPVAAFNRGTGAFVAKGRLYIVSLE